MLGYQIGFASPWYALWLGLLGAVLAWVWIRGWRRLRLLGRARRLAVLSARSAVTALIFLALAEVQIVRTSDELTVFYLLDQSLSIPAEHRRAMVEYVNAEVSRHRRQHDRAGVIVFGREAAIEVPPVDDDLRLPRIESPVDPEATSLAAALKLALAAFPDETAKRIVVVTDGNENLGAVDDQLPALGRAGVGIDVVPVRYRGRADVVVERLSVPSDVRRGQPFDLHVVLSNTAPDGSAGDGSVGGRLVISQIADGRTVVLGDEVVRLPPGKTVLTVRQQTDAASFFTYEARFIPHRPEDDAIPQNNRATAFTQVRGRGRVLLIENEDPDARGEFDVLVDRLRRQEIELTVQTPSKAFESLADLQAFDAVILGDVPRDQFTDEQIAMLARNTQQMGCGLVMLGGPNSFGAGGWNATEVEEAMPVDFQIKAAKVVPRGALALVIDRSGSMDGEKLEKAKAAAIAAVEVLSPHDYITVVVFDSEAQLTIPITENHNSRAIKARIARVASGGGTNLEPGLRLAFKQLSSLSDSAVRHMVVLSDGLTTGGGYPQLVGRFRAAGLTVSTVAVGDDADRQLLSRLAAVGGGNFYFAASPKILPRIFQREARRVARPLIWDKHPIRPEIRSNHPIVDGLPTGLPPLKAFVMTDQKDNPLVETLLSAPEAAGERNSTILAAWTYGLGKAAAFTSDAGARWAADWIPTPVYDQLFGELLRWSMRPAGDLGKFAVATEPVDGRLHVVVTALDKDDEYLNFLAMSGTVVGPDLEARPLRLEQVAPGRYEGVFEGGDAGSYLVHILAAAPADSTGPDARAGQPVSLRAGVNVPYSREFRDQASNEALLERLAATRPSGGRPGRLIATEAAPPDVEPLLAVDTFRRDLLRATASRDAWPLALVVCGCLFFCDVLVRRVQPEFAWLALWAVRARDFVLRRAPQPRRPESIERLRSRKAVVAGQLEQARSQARFDASDLESPRAAARFETADAPPADASALEEPRGRPGRHSPAVGDASQGAAATDGRPGGTDEGETYTERLLKAKKKAWKNRQPREH